MSDGIDIGFELKGFEDLEERLKALSADLAEKTIAGAVASAARIVRDEAARRAPRDPKSRHTRHLADQIVVKRDRKSAAGKNSVVFQIGPAKDAFYGLFGELGTSREPARPWLRPAMIVKRGEALDAMAKQIRRRLDRIERRASKGGK